MQIIMIAVVILNQNWILTTISIFVAYAAECLFFGLLCGIKINVIAPQFVLLAASLGIMTYYMETKNKSEFLQNKLNRTLKSEFKHMINVMPEAIVIFDPLTKMV